MHALILLAALMAPRADNERYWQAEVAEHWGGGSRVEVRLKDSSRVDIVTATHAVEVDWGKKWAESVGQSLHYANVTRLRAGVVLLVDGDNERRFIVRWLSATGGVPVDLWIVDTTAGTIRRHGTGRVEPLDLE